MARKRVFWFAIASAAMMVVALCAALPVQAQAASPDSPVLVYDGQTKEFSVRNGAADELFPTLENMVPGDVSTHSVEVQCQSTQKPVALYVRPSCSKDVADAIGSVRLTMKTGSTVLYDDEIGPLLSEGAQPVKVADFPADGSIGLEVSLAVPVALGNEAAGVKDAVRWTFVAQEEKGAPGSSGGPGDGLSQTGDGLVFAAAFAVAAAAFAVAAFSLRCVRRR